MSTSLLLQSRSQAPLNMNGVTQSRPHPSLNATLRQLTACMIQLPNSVFPRRFSGIALKRYSQVSATHRDTPASLDFKKRVKNVVGMRMRRRKTLQSSRRDLTNFHSRNGLLVPLEGARFWRHVAKQLKAHPTVLCDENHRLRVTFLAFPLGLGSLFTFLARDCQRQIPLPSSGMQSHPDSQQSCSACNPVGHRPAIPRPPQRQISRCDTRDSHDGHRNPEFRPFTRHTAKLSQAANGRSTLNCNLESSQ